MDQGEPGLTRPLAPRAPGRPDRPQGSDHDPSRDRDLGPAWPDDRALIDGGLIDGGLIDGDGDELIADEWSLEQAPSEPGRATGLAASDGGTGLAASDGGTGLAASDGGTGLAIRVAPDPTPVGAQHRADPAPDLVAHRSKTSRFASRRGRLRIADNRVRAAVAALSAIAFVWLWFRIATPHTVPPAVMLLTLGVVGVQAAWLIGRRRGAATIAGVVLLDLTFALLAAQIGVGGMFRSPALPNSADSTSHFMVVDYLREHLLPRGRIMGWSPESAGGWPVLRVYFPFAFLLAAALGMPIFGFSLLPADLAYNVALLASVFAYPLSVYVFVRTFGLRGVAPGLVALVSSIFLYDVHQVGLGGNLASLTMGEIAYSWSIPLALLALCAFERALRARRGAGWAMFLVAATVTSHVIGGLALLLGSLVLLVRHFRNGGWRRWLEVVGVGVAVTGVWLLPFLNGIPLSTNFGYAKHVAYRSMLLKWTAVCSGEGCGYSFPFWQVGHFKYVFFAGVFGVAWSLIKRRPVGLMVLGWGLLLALAFRFMPEDVLWNVRITPFYDVVVYIAGGIGLAAMCEALGALLRRLAGRRPNFFARRVVPAVVAGSVALGALLPVWHITRVNPVSKHWAAKVPILGSHEPAPEVVSWAGFVGGLLFGIQGRPGNAAEEASFARISGFVAEYRRIAKEVGCGSIYIEPGGDPDNGLAYNQILWNIGYWTDACIGSIQSHYYEGSPMSGYYFLADFMTGDKSEGNMRLLPYRDKRDGAIGIKMMRELGVRYLALHGQQSIPDAQATQGLVQVGAAGSWKIFEIQDMKVAEGLAKWPANLPDYGGKKAPGPLSRLLAMGDRVPTATWPWLDETIEWIQNPDGYAQKLVEGGPQDWPQAKVTTLHVSHGRTFGSGITVNVPQPVDVAMPAVISNLQRGNDWISFDVDRSNVPVIVRLPYDPMWVATGSSQPVRSSPNFMVIVPHDKHVELHARSTRTDRAGWVVTLIALAVGIGAVRRWRRDLVHDDSEQALLQELANRARARAQSRADSVEAGPTHQVDHVASRDDLSPQRAAADGHTASPTIQVSGHRWLDEAAHGDALRGPPYAERDTVGIGPAGRHSFGRETPVASKAGWRTASAGVAPL